MYLYPEGLKVVVEFLEHVEKVCEENNVTLAYHPCDNIGSERCRGYFCEPADGEAGELKVAIKRPVRDWFPVLIHEYCHLLQWLDEEPTYKACTLKRPKLADEDASIFMDYWLTKQVDLDEEKRIDYFRRVREMELNNERRAVDLIKIKNLPVNINRYIRGAAAYIYFYLAAEKFRAWYNPEVDMFNDLELMATMPYENLDGDFNELPSDIEVIFKKWMVKEDKNEGGRQGAPGPTDSGEDRGPRGAGDDRHIDSRSRDKDPSPDKEHKLFDRDPEAR